MSPYFKLSIEVLIGASTLIGLVKASLLSQETAIAVALISIVFLLFFEEARKDFHPIKNALSEMQKFLAKELKFIPLHEIKPVGFVVEHSPVQLTPLGKDLLEKSGAKKIIEDKYTEWEPQMNCKTALDVQTQASRIIATSENADYMKPLKDYVYTHPTFNDTPLSLSDVQRVMVIHLRNLYLQKHPEITPEK